MKFLAIAFLLGGLILEASLTTIPLFADFACVYSFIESELAVCFGFCFWNSSGPYGF